jgi:hypothetical protein
MNTHGDWVDKVPYQGQPAAGIDEQLVTCPAPLLGTVR